jgi:hypothetical protein
MSSSLNLGLSSAFRFDIVGPGFPIASQTRSSTPCPPIPSVRPSVKKSNLPPGGMIRAYVQEHIQLLLVFSTHAFFLSGCAVETREFRGTTSLQIEFFRNLLESRAKIAVANRSGGV